MDDPHVSMTEPRTILLLQGDTEARLLADAEGALEAVFGDGMQLIRAWAPRVDQLGDAAPAPSSLPPSEPPLQTIAELLAQPHRMVIIAVLPSITRSLLPLPGNQGVLAHETLLAQFPDDLASRLQTGVTTAPPLTPAAALAALEPQVEALLERGVAVALCNVFRHVRAPLSHGHGDGGGPAALRDQIRELNLGLARISHRTGCFIFDLDRALAQEGGGPLGVDCFGGAGRAAELALDELAALAMDALPDELMSFGDTELEMS